MKRMWIQWNIFPRRLDFIISTLMDLKKTSTAYARMAIDQRLPNFFECDPNLSLVNTPRLSSFLISSIYSFFKYLQYRKTQTSSGNVENMQLRFGPPGRDRFWHFASLAGISTPTLGNTWLDQPKNRCVNCGITYFLTLVKSRDDNRFRNYPTFFTLCVDQCFLTFFLPRLA